MKSKTPLALDTSAAGGRIPPDLAALPLEPQSPTHIDHIAIAWAALEALPPERRRKVLARVPPASTMGCIAPDTLANAPGVDICAKRCRALAVSQMRRGWRVPPWKSVCHRTTRHRAGYLRTSSPTGSRRRASANNGAIREESRMMKLWGCRLHSSTIQCGGFEGRPAH